MNRRDTPSDRGDHWCSPGLGVTALADTARRTIAEHETLVLSDRDREAFFEALINPPAPSGRLERALADHKRRVAS